MLQRSRAAGKWLVEVESRHASGARPVVVSLCRNQARKGTLQPRGDRASPLAPNTAAGGLPLFPQAVNIEERIRFSRLPREVREW